MLSGAQGPVHTCEEHGCRSGEFRGRGPFFGVNLGDTASHSALLGLARVLGSSAVALTFLYVVLRNMLETIDAEWDLVLCRERCVADEHHRWSALDFVFFEMHGDKSLKVCLSDTNR